MADRDLNRQFTPAQIVRLKAEAKAPYRGLRKFVYVACGASGTIGAVVFFTQLLAGKGDFSTVLGNLAIQISVMAVMVWLFRLERRFEKKD
jgi:hypothetical protein